MMNVVRNDISLIKKMIQSSKLNEMDKMANDLKNQAFDIDIIKEV